jgi:hypothetical protein
LSRLPAASRELLLVAAAEPVGDPLTVWHAAELLGVGAEAAGPASGAGLVEFGGRVRFRHPLVRSAVYRSSEAEDRLRVHRALAEATDAEASPTAEPGIWHTRRRASTRTSPPSSRNRPAVRRRAAGSPPRRRSCSGPPS